jgi:hypothetical protein
MRMAHTTTIANAATARAHAGCDHKFRGSSSTSTSARVNWSICPPRTQEKISSIQLKHMPEHLSQLRISRTLALAPTLDPRSLSNERTKEKGNIKSQVNPCI